MLRASLFGPLALEFDGDVLRPPPGARARSVLAWLLLHPGLHMRAHVAARLWPDVLDRSARASLRTALWEIRRAVDRDGRPPWLEVSRERVGMPADLPRRLDVEEFERRIASDDPGDRAAALDLAIQPLLTDLADDWVLERRDDIQDRVAAVAAGLGDEAAAAGDLTAAIEWCRRAVRHAPLDERCHRALMRRLAESGDRAQAVVVYERLAAALSAQLGVEPSRATRELADRMRRRPAAHDAPGVVEEAALCRAPALEVWKLLQDPLRYPEWWDGLVDIKPGPDGHTRWMGALPGVPIPTRVELRRAARGVVIRCEVTGIVHVWTLEPAPEGCRVRLRAAVPAQESDRWLAQQGSEARASLPRLVQAAERSAAAAA